MINIPLSHPGVIRAANWLRDTRPIENIQRYGMTAEFENYFNCRIVSNVSVTFDNDADATAFLLRWS